MKTVYILWSGGLDSTFLIWKNLTEGNKVIAKYIELENNEHKSEMELDAIYKLRKLFKEEFKDNFEYSYLLSIDIVESAHTVRLPQYPSWFTGCVYGLGDNIDEIQLGYVMNDDAISYLDDMKSLWKAYEPLYNGSTPFPELTFPLTKIHKKDYISVFNFPKKYYELTVWCENPTYTHGCYIPCGECYPCERAKEVFPEFYKKFNNEKRYT